jgi:hypothetical protein
MTDLHRFAAFISYSSKDAAFARKLHAALEAYRVPTALGAFKLAASGRPNRIFPVFRDREELAAGELGEAIESALAHSGALIVVCSPNAAASPWVDKEIQSFLKQGRKDRVFAIFAADAPVTLADGSDASQACFPPSFRGDAETGAGFEPIAADARKGKDGFRNAWLKIVAGLIGVNAGALQDRDRKMRARQRIAAGALSAMVVGALGALVGLAYQETSRGELSRADVLIEAAQSAPNDAAFRYLTAARLIGVRAEQRDPVNQRLRLLANLIAPPSAQGGSMESDVRAQMPLVDGRRSAAFEAGAPARVTIWDLATRTVRASHPLQGADYEVTRLADDQDVWLAYGDDKAEVVRIGADDSITAQVLYSGSSLGAAGVSPDGRWIALGTATEVMLYDATAGALKGSAKLPGCTDFCSVYDIRFGSQRAVFIAGNGAVVALDLRDGSVAFQAPPQANQSVEMRSAQLSPDGRWLALAYDSAGADIYDMQAGQRVFRAPAVYYERGLGWRGDEFISIQWTEDGPPESRGVFSTRTDGSRRRLSDLPPIFQGIAEEDQKFETTTSADGSVITGVAWVKQSEEVVRLHWPLAQLPDGLQVRRLSEGECAAIRCQDGGVGKRYEQRLRTAPTSFEAALFTLSPSLAHARPVVSAWPSQESGRIVQLRGDDQRIPDAVLRDGQFGGLVAGPFELPGLRAAWVSPSGGRLILVSEPRAELVEIGARGARRAIDLASTLCTEQGCDNVEQVLWNADETEISLLHAQFRSSTRFTSFDWANPAQPRTIALAPKFTDELKTEVLKVLPGAAQMLTRNTIQVSANQGVKAPRFELRVQDIPGGAARAAVALERWDSRVWAVSGDGALIVYPDRERRMLAWRWRDGAAPAIAIAGSSAFELPEHITLSDEGSILVATYRDMARIWSMRDGALLGAFTPMQQGENVNDLFMTADPARKVVREIDPRVATWREHTFARADVDVIAAACAAVSPFTNEDVVRFGLSRTEACPCAARSVGPLPLRRVARALRWDRPLTQAPQCTTAP